MALPTDRILVYDRSLSFLFELVPDEITKRERTEELNGTHELELVTSRVLHEGYRLLTVDNTGKWREHVVYKPDEGHEKGKHAAGTYVSMWSLQYDLIGTVEGNVAQPGMGSSCSSKNAVTAAIGGQSIWTAGECDVPAVAAGKGVVMVGNNAWDRLKQVVGAWGGEVDAEITVSSTKVVTRKVVLRTHLGSTKAVRRFDWGEDLTKIHRTPDPGPYFCRILPFGKGQREYAEDDETEFDWPSDVTEEPYSEGDGWVHDNGSAFVRDPEAEAVFRTADGHGGWHYPTKEVKYDEDDPELLLNEATADIHNHTRPSVSYEADVLQFAEAGMDAQGVALGDDVQCVDYGFNPDAALRVQGRITRMVVNELAPKTDTKLTIGDLGTSFAATLKDLIGANTQSLSNRLNHIEGDVTSITDGGTIAYVEALLDAINAKIAADGGYMYLANGQGSITYDKAVANPLVGTEATQVTQMKGGSLRFANSKKPGFQGIDDWNWATVITPDGFLGLAATIAAITTGFIGSSGDTYINLDEHIAQIGQSSGPHLIVDANGVLVYNASTLLGFFGLESSNGIVRIGENGKMRSEIDWHSFRLIDLNGTSCFNVQDLRDTSGYATVEETWPIEEGSSAGRYILSATPTNTTYDVYVNSTRLTYGVNKYSDFFDISYNFGSSGTVRAVYTTTSNRATICTIGSRASGTTLGIGSAAIGTNVTASGGMSHAEGLETKALNHCSHAEGYQTEAANVFAHAEGSGSKANGEASHAGGKDSKADGRYSFAHGEDCEATGNYSIACGCQAKATSGSGSAAFGDGVTQSARGLACGGHNSTTDALFVVGSGTSSSNKKDAFYVRSSASYIPHGDLYVSGYVFDSSDRRLKKHVKYIDDDASEFIRKLRPALFEKDDSLQVGFYAQDVQNADEWGTSTVVETDMRSKELGFKPLTLNYQALIAPLVAYTQQLEKRIDEQQKQIDKLIEHIEALEGGA